MSIPAVNIFKSIQLFDCNIFFSSKALQKYTTTFNDTITKFKKQSVCNQSYTPNSFSRSSAAIHPSLSARSSALFKSILSDASACSLRVSLLFWLTKNGNPSTLIVYCIKVLKASTINIISSFS